MTIIAKLKLVTVVLGVTAAVASTLVRGDSNTGKPVLGGFNPAGVKLREDLMGNRFGKQPVVQYDAT